MYRSKLPNPEYLARIARGSAGRGAPQLLSQSCDGADIRSVLLVDLLGGA